MAMSYESDHPLCPCCGAYTHSEDWPRQASDPEWCRDFGSKLGMAKCLTCEALMPLDKAIAAEPVMRPLWHWFRDHEAPQLQTRLFELRYELACYDRLKAALADLGLRLRELGQDRYAWLRRELADEAEYLADTLDPELDDEDRPYQPRELLADLHCLHQRIALDARDWRLIGELLVLLGDPPQAARAWRKALKLDDRVGVKRRLAELEKELGGEPS